MTSRPMIRALTGAAALAVGAVLIAGCDSETGSSPSSAPERGQTTPTGETGSDSGSPGAAANFDQLPGPQFETTANNVVEGGARVRYKVLKASWAETVGDRPDKPGERYLVVYLAVDLEKAAKTGMDLHKLLTVGGDASCPGELRIPMDDPPNTCEGVNKLTYAPLVAYQSDWESENWKPRYNQPAYQPGQVYVGAVATGIPDGFAPDKFQVCVPVTGDINKGQCVDIDVPDRP